MMWDGGMGPAGWIGMSLMMILFWGGIIALVVWAIRATRVDRSWSPPRERAPDTDDLLAERFARGDIDEEEFTRRREVLHQR